MPLALVTGANGAIGRHVVAHLKGLGWTIGGLGHGPPTWLPTPSIDHWIAGDVSGENLDAIAKRLGPPDVVIGLAGGSAVGPSLITPLSDFERTVLATIRTLNWIWTRAPKSHFVSVSSAAVYGDRHDAPIDEAVVPNPISPYGHHKLMMEQAVRYWAKIFGVSAVICRPFSVYGPGLQKQIAFDVCKRLSRSPKTLVLSGTGNEKRDWVSIRDAARLLVELADHASTDVPTFNLCTGSGQSVAELAKLLSDTWDSKTIITFDGVSRPGDPVDLVGSSARMLAAGLETRFSLQEGILDLVKFMKRSKI